MSASIKNYSNVVTESLLLRNEILRYEISTDVNETDVVKTTAEYSDEADDKHLITVR